MKVKFEHEDSNDDFEILAMSCRHPFDVIARGHVIGHLEERRK